MRFTPATGYPVVCAVARTPVGAHLGVLSRFSAPKLSALCVAPCLRASQVNATSITQLVCGQSVASGSGASPCSVIAQLSKLPSSVVGYSVSQGFCTGLRSVALAAQSVMLSPEQVVVSIGVESSSHSPFLFLSPRTKNHFSLGHHTSHDGLLHDGFTDSMLKQPLSNSIASMISREKISPEAQSIFVAESKRRCTLALSEAVYTRHIVPVRVPSELKTEAAFAVDEDEYIKPFRKLPDTSLLCTAVPTASPGDGAAAIVFKKSSDQLASPPLARILAITECGGASLDMIPETIVAAVKKVVREAGAPRLDLLEVEEVFPAVALQVTKLLSMDNTRVNCYGGSSALGLPIGMAGVRNFMSLLAAMIAQQRVVGCVVSYDGGGNALAVLVERMQ